MNNREGKGVDWSTDWLYHHRFYKVTQFFTHWMTDLQTEWLSDHLYYCLTDLLEKDLLSTWMTVWLTAWLSMVLTVWRIDSLTVVKWPTD